MILYFANRIMNILGMAGTNLPKGFVILEDNKTEEINSGVATFECKIGFTKDNRSRLEAMTKAGNYLLRKNDNECEFYTIIDSELDSKNQEIYVYAEDAGLDLINEIAEPYEATEAHPAEWYVNKWIVDSGFEIGINEIPASSKRKLSWDGESTVTERLASIATQFDGYEVSYSFEVKGMEVAKKYVNFFKERGKDTGAKLRLNYEIDRIVIKKSVANLATALRCTGGTPEGSDEPITLKGFYYDDGDIYIGEDGILRSRNANAKWSRYVWNKEPNIINGYAGHIIRSYSYDTTSPDTLCNHAVAELKKICDMEVNYEVDIPKLPDNVKIGDRVDIIDDAGEVYFSARILVLEKSVTDGTNKATIGEYLIKEGGISLKVTELAEQLAIASKSAAAAKVKADAAMVGAENATTTANNALTEANNANTKADEAAASASSAQSTAAAAQQAANNATAAVDNVEKSVESLETTVSNAQQAANNAQQAAETAQSKADEAAQAAAEALADAADASAAVVVAQGKAETAISKAETAQSTADIAKSEAATAQATANAAKLDAEAANKEIEEFASNLETLSQTMEADYARKTELTEAKASLQTQITQNANEISSTSTRVTEIDETANNAAELAQAAQTTANLAQATADAATADAEAAQKAADDAASAAQAAQSEADTAKAAASTAQGVADKAKADLEAAKADLATVQGRVDATEEDIAAAEKAVETAQAAADTAKADAATAAQKATAAQSTADTAKANAETAQTAANNASAQATAAQTAAQAAQGDATAAQETADNAKVLAQAAQSTADTAKNNAATAQSKADAAAQAAEAAQTAADNADAKAAAAASDLATAKSNLAAVTSRVDATEAEIEEAEAAVAAAQAAADSAAAEAAAAQSTANTAKANAATAQTAANNAKTAADNAQKAADDAQDAADAAQAAVDSLAVRVTTAETKITQNSEQISLRATKTEVATTLGGYYNKTQTDALIKVEADKITSQAKKIDGLTSRTSTLEQTADGLTLELESLTVGGRNLIAGTSKTTEYSGNKGSASYNDVWAGKTIDIPTGSEYIVSFEAKAAVAQTISCFFYNPNTTTKAESSTGHSSTSADGMCNVAITTEWKRYWVKWTQTAATAAKNVIVGRNTTANNIYIRAVKLEEGNRATSWTPAPEDVAGSISNAAKTATNYLSFSNSGLIVGDMTASTLGKNVLIDSDSVDIRNGTTVLASFGANLIELGKGSNTVGINFGGYGSVGYGVVGTFSGQRMYLTGTKPTLYGLNNDVMMLSQAGTTDYSYIKANHEQIDLQALHAGAEAADGTAIFSGSEMRVSRYDIYGLADEIQFVSRNDLILQTVSGDIEIPAGNLVTTERIHANGGLRLGNGGQITGNTSSGTEITMLQMNANNYTMLGYGGYINKIGATYVDGNSITMRSNSTVEIYGATTFANATTMLGAINAKGCIEIFAGVPFIDFHFANSTADYTARIAEESEKRLSIRADNGVRLFAGNTSTGTTTGFCVLPGDSSYNCYIRPTDDAGTPLGVAANRWYRVYASISSISTSDRRQKENIIPLGIEQLMPSDDGGPDKVVDLHSELFDRLEPVQYNLIKGNNRICYGLIAQDVLGAMHEIGIGENELDLVYHDEWTDEETGDYKDAYGIAYENLIAVLIHEVQKLKNEVKNLKAS